MSVKFTVKRNVKDIDMDVEMDHGDMGMMDVDTWLPNTWWMPPMHNVWNTNDFYQLVIMWSIMMIAMMSPSIIPTVLMFATVNKAKQKNNLQYTPTYILLWLLNFMDIILNCNFYYSIPSPSNQSNESHDGFNEQLFFWSGFYTSWNISINSL